MRIDSYTLFGRWPYWEIKTKTAEDMLSLMDEYEIDKAAVISTRSIFLDYQEGNGEVLDLMKRYSRRVIGIATVNPKGKGEAKDDFHRSLEEGMRGIALFPLYHGYRLGAEPVLDTILAEAVERRMPILIPTRLLMNWTMPTLDGREARKLFSRFPEGRFLLMAVNREVDALEAMRDHQNVSLETSCAQGAYAIERFIADFGIERVLYGSGLPLQYPGCGLAKIEGAEISEGEKEQIFSQNAMNLFGL